MNGHVASPQPRNDQLGYEASLDLGIAALGHGLTAAAVPYLERAVTLRSTRFALVQLGKAHRDLGQHEAARDRLLQARSLPDGNDLFVLVSLATAHCDLQEYGSAFEVAMAAAHLKPEDPAALSVLARCMRESASALGKHSHIDPGAIDAILAQADAFTREAQEAQPDSLSDLKDRRRRRASQAWQVPPPSGASTPVEQIPAAVLDHSTILRRHETQDDSDPEPESVSLPISNTRTASKSGWRQTWQRFVASLRPR